MIRKIAAVSLIFASMISCIAPNIQENASKPVDTLIHEGKQLRLVRKATPEELLSSAKRFEIKPGDQVWHYETVLEFLASETGFCLVRSGKVVSRYFISAS